MKEIKFIKNVSKGSRFNQVYIPNDYKALIEPGDIVEVKLVKKSLELFCFPKTLKLSEFKEELIKEIFSHLASYGLKHYFIVGSFLTRISRYNDIDIVIISDAAFKGIEGELTEKFSLKFHLFSIRENKLHDLYKKCPLTRNMFSTYVSNKELNFSSDKIIDKNYLKYLMMMPQDILDVEVSSIVYLKNLKRLISIKGFLENKDLNNRAIESELKELVGSNLFSLMENDEPLNKAEIGNVREHVRGLIKNIVNRL